MRKPLNQDSRKIGAPHCVRSRRHVAGAMLVPLLAVASVLVSPSTAQAIDRHPRTHQLPHRSHGHRLNRSQPRKGASAASLRLTALHEEPGEAALHFAASQLGKPYRYGGTGPNSYDCSGLTQRAWRAAGVAIPRTSQEQARFGSYVPFSQLRPGDLVVFYPNASHVGIYAGGGKVIVAPRPGKVVTYQEMRWMPVHTIRRPG